MQVHQLLWKNSKAMKQTKNSKIYLSVPHMGGDELNLVKQAFDSNWLSSVGEHIDSFEQELCDKFNVNQCVALSSGTAAIHLGLKLLGVEAGDYVLCSSFTFAASAFPVKYLGASPVFVDSDLDTWNLCPDSLELAITELLKKNKKPKALIAVDLYGQSCNFNKIKEICNRYDILILEDAAEAIGAKYNNQYCGSFGDVGVFSFNGNKMITTTGGGALVCTKEEQKAKVKKWSTQSRENCLHYEHAELGFNYRMSNVLAAIGRGQLSVLDERIEQRRTVFQAYQADLGPIEQISFMPEFEASFNTRWLSVICVPQEDRLPLIQCLAEHNIESRPVWKPMHKQPVFEGCEFYSAAGNTESVCDKLYEVGLCLPSSSSLSNDEQTLIVDLVKQYFDK